MWLLPQMKKGQNKYARNVYFGVNGKCRFVSFFAGSFRCVLVLAGVRTFSNIFVHYFLAVVCRLRCVPISIWARGGSADFLAAEDTEEWLCEQTTP